jgi:uncharacterized membrane protein
MKLTQDKKRHIYKTITWRIVATLTTMVIAWKITNNHKIGFTVGIIEFFIKMILYYIHERAWFKLFKMKK